MIICLSCLTSVQSQIVFNFMKYFVKIKIFGQYISGNVLVLQLLNNFLYCFYDWCIDSSVIKKKKKIIVIEY